MQSWLNNLPAIQTGMFVVSAVTFHSTGSEVWLRQRTTTTTAAAAAATATTGTAGKHRYNTLLSSSSPSFPSIMRLDQKLISPEFVTLNLSSMSEPKWKFREKGDLSLFHRPSWNIGTDPSAFPFPDSNRLDHHSTARKYPALQHSTDPHDPHHTSHTSLRELWNSTTATVCFISNAKMVTRYACREIHSGAKIRHKMN